MAASVLPPPLAEGDRLTRDEFMRRWEAMPDLRWAELIDGIVYMPSPVATFHSNFHMLLSSWLGYYLKFTPGCTAGSDGTWLMTDDSVPQPDLALCIEPERGGQSRVEGDYSAGAPELIVEVSHRTRSKDNGKKRMLYERCGVREYVNVVSSREIVWRQLVSGRFAEIAPDADGWFRSRVFPGLWLDPEALWNADYAGLAAVVERGVATPEHGDFVARLAKFGV